MARIGAEAIAWARRNADRPPAGLGATDGTWFRMCLQFVRSALGLPGGIANAGLAWDRATRKHRTSNPADIPAGVPVFWELPSVEDHVALSIGGGLCISTDARRRGAADVVAIDSITRGWNAQLLGWTEDLNGVLIWTAPAPPARKPTVNITRALTAKTRGARRRALERVAERGGKAAAAAARRWLAAMDEVDEARRDLRKHEVRP